MKWDDGWLYERIKLFRLYCKPEESKVAFVLKEKFW